jgi:hypothetical protein
MKNVYNLISDAFSGLSEQEHRELDYIKDVVYSQDLVTHRSFYEITIQSYDETVQGRAFLKLTLNSNQVLIKIEEENDLFLNENWDSFCSVFAMEMPRLQALTQILQILNG